MRPNAFNLYKCVAPSVSTPVHSFQTPGKHCIFLMRQSRSRTRSHYVMKLRISPAHTKIINRSAFHSYVKFRVVSSAEIDYSNPPHSTCTVSMIKHVHMCTCTCIYMYVHVHCVCTMSNHQYKSGICTMYSVPTCMYSAPYMIYTCMYVPQLESNVVAVDEVASKHKRVLWSEHSVDPAWTHGRSLIHTTHLYIRDMYIHVHVFVCCCLATKVL